MRLPIGIARGAGLVIQNPPGNPVYQPLRSGHGDLHLHWQPVYQDVIRSVGPLCAFLPSATYEGSGERVIFSKIENGRDLLSLSRPLGRNEGIPDDVLAGLESALRSFKAIAQREGTSPDVRRFVEEFTLPSVLRFPDAYRVYQAGPFSRRRYFILWGFEPIGLTSLTRADIGQVQLELRERGAASLDGMRPMARLLAFVCLLAALAWVVAYMLLPEPRANFTIVATAKQLATVENTSSTEKTFGIDFGNTAYLWSFEGAQPAQSEQSNPQPVWMDPGDRKVSLKVTHSSILGLSKTDVLPRDISVYPGINPAPLPPVPIPSPDSNEIIDGDEPFNIGNGNNTPNAEVGGTRQGPVIEGPGNGNVGGANDVQNGGGGGGSGSESITNGNPSSSSADADKSKKGSSGANGGSGTTPQDGKGTVQPAPTPPNKEDAPMGSGRINDANLVWYRIVPADQGSDEVIVTLDVVPPQGYRVVKVSFNGTGRIYTGGRFDQRANNGSNEVEIEIESRDGSGARKTLSGIWDCKLTTGTRGVPSKSSPDRTQEPGEKPDAIDPSKVPNLSA